MSSAHEDKLLDENIQYHKTVIAFEKEIIARGERIEELQAENVMLQNQRITIRETCVLWKERAQKAEASNQRQLQTELDKVKPVLDAAISFVEKSRVPFVKIGGTTYRASRCRYTDALCEAVREYNKED